MTQSNLDLAIELKSRLKPKCKCKSLTNANQIAIQLLYDCLDDYIVEKRYDIP